MRALLAASTNRYRNGQPELARAAGQVLRQLLAPQELSAIWIGEQAAYEHGPFPKFWLLYWSATNQRVPGALPQRVATLADVLAHRYPQGWREPTDEERAG